MVELERDTIQAMRAGQQAYRPLATSVTRQAVQQASPHLSEHQRAAVEQILASRDQVVALEGVAGAGKTTALAAVREGAEREGYRVEGFAPTSRAAQKLAEAGIPTSTLQRHLAQAEAPRDGSKHLYVLDESSLASTKQMHDFLQRLGPQDRVLLVGDVRQHQAVEAGRPYQQLQEAGHRDGPPRRHRAAAGPGPQARRRATVARRGARRHPATSTHQGRVHEIADRQRAVHRHRARLRTVPGRDAGRVAGQSVAAWRSTRRSTG